MPRKLKKSTRSSGKLGEEYAVRLLKDKGYKIIEKNFRSKIGEIDIIAKDGDFLVFVEVKTRWSRRYGRPEEAVTGKKLGRIKRVGELYLKTRPNLPKKMRVDIVAIEVSGEKVKSSKIIRAD